MDYKYIEQLIERYWECETSQQEEDILRAFFAQDDVPASLARYKRLFVYEQQQKEQPLLDDSFDQRVRAAIGHTHTTAEPAHIAAAQRIGLTRRLRPLSRAAAAVAIITLLGTAAQHSFTSPRNTTGWDYNQSAYKDSYQDPQKAYEASMKTLQLFKEGAQTAVNDSAHHDDSHIKATH